MAGILGLLTGSVAMFASTGTVMIGADIYTGEIRPSQGQRQQGHGD